MERKTFEDVPGGDTVVYDVADPSNNYRLCTFGQTLEGHEAIFNNLPNFPIRDDDIILASYPKTGTNWLWEMILLALSKTTEVTGRSKGEMMLEAFPPEIFEQIPSPRLLNNHLLPRYEPKMMVEKKLKVILLLRNPKDVVVSFYNHTKGIGMYEYDGKFENYLQMFVRGEVDYGSYHGYLREWQQFIKDNKDYPILTVYYEDLQLDCLSEMKRICKFLNIDDDEERLSEICSGCKIDNMKKTKIAKMSDEMKEAFKHILKGGFTIFRKGKVGDWKNWFTVAQNEMFDAWWSEQTSDIDLFSFKYTI
ncbi:sulfotransferase 1 [Mactra antiquata]